MQSGATKESWHEAIPLSRNLWLHNQANYKQVCKGLGVSCLGPMLPWEMGKGRREKKRRGRGKNEERGRK